MQDYTQNGKKPVWKIGGRNLDFNQSPIIMGILNVTPDSFSNGGRFYDPARAVEHALTMIEQGATIIDVGGESTRPGADPVSREEELERILPVIRGIRRASDTFISVDTYKSAVAEAALQAGADIVNDISSCTFDPEMIDLLRGKKCPVIIMHIKGTPKHMQQNPVYDDVIAEIYRFFESRISDLQQKGINEIIIDPGIGFGKRLEDNLRILRDLEDFKFLDKPLLIGTSRKSFIGRITGKDEDQRLSGTLASNLVSVINGADILRVHDVAEMDEALKIYRAIYSL